MLRISEGFVGFQQIGALNQNVVEVQQPSFAFIGGERALQMSYLVCLILPDP